MSKEKQYEKVIGKINAEIEKLESNNSTAYFFVLDSKGNPNGGIEYVYRMAKALQDRGQKVCMMYQEKLVKQTDEEGSPVLDAEGKNVMVDPFVGVRTWMGSDYSDLPHVNSATEDIKLTPSDILFIPEIFASVMRDTRSFPCKRIAIVTNYDYLVESLPIGEQWANYGITDAVVPSASVAEQVKEIFPYVNTTVITPTVDEMYGENKPKLKNLVINIVAKNRDDIHKVVNPFYWRFPMFKWVIFKELKGMNFSQFASTLKEGSILLYIDDDTASGIVALEAMKAGSIVVGKLPKILPDWLFDKEKQEFKNNGLWFDDLKSAPTVLANAVRMSITDTVPAEMIESQNAVVAAYTEDKTGEAALELVTTIKNERLEELKRSLEQVNAQINKTEEA